MKELTREVKTIETYGYKADDGTFFKTKEECQKYEETAKMVCYGKAKQYLIGETTECCLTEFGSDENSIEIYNVPDMEAAKVIEQYIILETHGDDDFVGKVTSRIGKKVMACWGYEREWCWVTSVEEYTEMIQKNFERAMKKEEK